MAGVGVEGQLALHAELLDHLLGEILGQLMRHLHRPEFRHHEVGVHAMEAAGADGAQVVDANHALRDVAAEHIEDAAEQGRVLLVQEAAGGVAHEAGLSALKRL